MDSLINAAARSLAAGDPLGALKRVALRDDPPGLALRGIAMAQLGELARARQLLRQAAQGFGEAEPLLRARCVTAETEVSLALRDLDQDTTALDDAVAVLDQHADHVNAAHARLIGVRRHLLLGELAQADALLAATELSAAPSMLRAIGELLRADIAMRRAQAGASRAALERARKAASHAGIRALGAEIDQLLAQLDKPAARLLSAGQERPIVLAELEALLGSARLFIDACRRVVRAAGDVRALTTRPVLFALVRCLAEAWPEEAPRQALMKAAFGTRHFNDSLRARLRVEIGRLRKLLGGLAQIEASPHGFVLRSDREVVVVLPPVDGADASLLALLADGEAWSTSSLALALGVSQRTVQRALGRLSEQGQVLAMGRARARRWLAPPISEYTTALLLPGATIAR